MEYWLNYTWSSPMIPWDADESKNEEAKELNTEEYQNEEAKELNTEEYQNMWSTYAE